MVLAKRYSGARDGAKTVVFNTIGESGTDLLETTRTAPAPQKN